MLHLLKKAKHLARSFVSTTELRFVLHVKIIRLTLMNYENQLHHIIFKQTTLHYHKILTQITKNFIWQPIQLKSTISSNSNRKKSLTHKNRDEADTEAFELLNYVRFHFMFHLSRLQSCFKYYMACKLKISLSRKLNR